MKSIWILLLSIIAGDILGSAYLHFFKDKLENPVPPFNLLFQESQNEAFKSDEKEFVIFDPDLGWSLRPNAKSSQGYTSNSQGLHATREYAIKTPPGVKRIAVFGDSFAFGDKVSDSENWCSVIEQTNPHVEVLNFGINAYSVDQALLRYRRDAKKFKPDIVIIEFVLHNIMAMANYFRPFYNHKTGVPYFKPRFIEENGNLKLLPMPFRTLEEMGSAIKNGEIFPLVKGKDFWFDRAPQAYNHNFPLFLSSFGRLAYARFENPRDDAALFADPQGESFRLMVQVIQQFYKEAIADGAKSALVVILPHKDELKKPDHRYWATLIEAMEKNRIPFVEMITEIKPILAKEGFDKIFSMDAGHYTAYGHRVVAEILERKLGLR